MRLCTCDVHSLSFLFKFNCCICFRSLINCFQNLGYAVLLLFLSFSDLYLSMFFLDIILFKFPTDLWSCHLDHDHDQQYHSLDCIIDQGVHLQADNNLIDNCIGHRSKQDPQASSFSTGHADAAENNCCDGVHLIAGSCCCRVAGCVHGNPEKCCYTYQCTTDCKYRDLHGRNIDACHSRTFEVASYCIDFLAIFGTCSNKYKQDSQHDQNNSHIRDAGCFSISHVVEHLIRALVRCHLIHRTSISNEYFIHMLAEILCKRTVHQHSCQSYDKCRHFHQTYHHSVYQTAECTKHDRE